MKHAHNHQADHVQSYVCVSEREVGQRRQLVVAVLLAGDDGEQQSDGHPETIQHDTH